MSIVLQRERPLEGGHARYSRSERRAGRGGRSEVARVPSIGGGGRDRGEWEDVAPERVDGVPGERAARTVATVASGDVRDRRTARWVRVVPAESRRPPTRSGRVRPRVRVPVRACSGARITPQGWLLIAVAAGVFSFVVMFGLLAQALAATGGSGDGAAVPADTAVVSVGAGESLWDVAESAAPEADPAAVVTRIRELNDLSGGAVGAGTPLVVPVGS